MHAGEQEIRRVTAELWASTPPAARAAEFWRVLAARVTAATGTRQTPASVATRAGRVGLQARVLKRDGVGLCTLRVTRNAAICPYCGAQFALAAGVDAGLLPAFAAEHGACRRAYNKGRDND